MEQTLYKKIQYKISNFSKGQKCTFMILKKLNAIDAQINTTKIVIMTQHNCNQKDFTIR